MKNNMTFTGQGLAHPEASQKLINNKDNAQSPVMNKPTAYHIEITGPSRAPIRVLTLNKSPWFVLEDVLAASGAQSSDLDPFPDFGREIVLLPVDARNEKTEIVDESAFLWLAMRGWQFAAGSSHHHFAEWVATDLIPHVRLHGNYILPMPEASHA